MKGTRRTELICTDVRLMTSSDIFKTYDEYVFIVQSTNKHWWALFVYKDADLNFSLTLSSQI